MKVVTTSFKGVVDDTQVAGSPCIIFLHGISERGDGTEAGMKPLEDFIASADNNIDKALQKFYTNNKQFVLVAPQLMYPKGEWDIATIDAAYNYAINLPSVDKTRISLVGVSLGGGGVVKYISVSGNAKRFNVAIAICPAWASGFDFKIIAASGLPLWTFHASDDGVVNVSSTNSIVDGINANNPVIKAKKTIYSTGNHYIWGRVFDPEVPPGVDGEKATIYDWMLLNTNVSHVAVTGGTTGTTTTTTTTTPTFKAIADVKNITATNATLDASASTGDIKYYAWRILKFPANGTWNIFTSGNGGPVVKVSNLVAGDYEVELTVGGGGNMAKIVVPFTIGAAVSPIFVQSDIPTGKTKVIVREDKTIEFL